MDDQGHLICAYLGTDPSLFVAPSADSREINYEEQDLEMKKLQRMIKESASKQGMKNKNNNDKYTNNNYTQDRNNCEGAMTWKPSVLG